MNALVRLRSAAVLAALALALAGCGATVVPLIGSESDRLSAARHLMSRRDYFPAIELLKTYIERNAGSEHVDEGVYLLGDCYLHQKEWASAEVEFERLLRDYPESDSAAAASYRLGEALYGQSRGEDFDQEFTNKALEQWQRYSEGFPDHWLHAEAESQIARLRARLARKLLNNGVLYLKLDEPAAARAYFERVESDYRDTPLVGEAWIGIARCDILGGAREKGIARLRSLAETYAGEPLGTRAAEELKRALKSKPRKPKHSHRATETN